MRIETKIAIVETPNPHSHPLLSSNQTTNVTATSAPQARQNTKQLKYVDLCFRPLGVLSSNCSAPCDGNDPLIPPTPKATRYNPTNSITALEPLTASHVGPSHVGGIKDGVRAWIVSMINPCTSPKLYYNPLIRDVLFSRSYKRIWDQGHVKSTRMSLTLVVHGRQSSDVYK